MSHYAVAVFMTDDKESVEELLAPYDENIRVTPYVASTKAELIQAEKNWIQKTFDGPYSEWKKNPKEYEASHKDSNYIAYLKKIPAELKLTDEELYQRAIKGCNKNEMTQDGGLLSTYNPGSKWDWYQIGGRWQGKLLLKPKKKGIRGEPGLRTKKSGGYDGAFACDIDFEAIKQHDASELFPYEEMLNEGIYSKEYLLARYPTEEEYIHRKTTFSTYAAVTPDGIWHAPGKMGWWGISMAEADDERAWSRDYEERFIKPAIENNWYMMIVDCHI